MTTMDVERYKRIGSVAGVKLKPEFRVTEKTLQSLEQYQTMFQNCKNQASLMGTWVSVENFVKSFSAYAMQNFNKQSGTLVVRDDKGVQNPETFAHDVLAEVAAECAYYIPEQPADNTVKIPSKVKCVREEDIARVLSSYYVIAQKNSEKPIVASVKNGELESPNDEKARYQIEARPFQNPTKSSIPLSSIQLQKFRKWYFSGKSLPLDEKEKTLFSETLELFVSKYEEGKRGQNIEEWMAKTFNNGQSLSGSRLQKLFHKSGLTFDAWLGELIPEKTFKVNKTTGSKVYSKVMEGEYISQDEFRSALLKYFKEREKDFTLKVMKKDKGVINVEELAESIVQMIAQNGKIKVENKPSNPNPKKPKLSDIFERKVQLPNGSFVHLQEVVESMQNYLVIEKEKYRPRVPPVIVEENLLDKFIEWLKSHLKGVKLDIDLDLSNKFKDALVWLQLLWKDTNAKDPKQLRKGFKGWLIDWINENDPKGPKKKEGGSSKGGKEPREPVGSDPREPVGGGDPREPVGGSDPRRPVGGGDPRRPVGGDPREPIGGGDPRGPVGGGNPRRPVGSDPREPVGGGDPRGPVGGDDPREPVGDGDPTSNPPKTFRVIRVEKEAVTKAMVLVLGGVLAASILASGFGMTGVEVPETKTITTTGTQSVFVQKNADYDLSIIGQTQKEVAATPEEILSYIRSEIEKNGNIKLGDYQNVKVGDVYYNMASTSSKSAVIDEDKVHPAGQYMVTGLAISDGKNIAYIENFAAKDMNTALVQIAEEAEAKGIDWSKAEVFVHLGSSKTPIINEDGTEGRNWRAGWFKSDDYSFANMPTSKIQIDEFKTQETGTIEDFKGTDVVINGQSYRVVDEDGKPLKPGSYVNANGVKYEVNEVNVTDVYKDQTVTKTETVTETKTVKKLSYNLGVFQILGLGALAGLGVMLELTRRKINKKFKENPNFIAFGDTVSYEEFRENFELTAKEMGRKLSDKDIDEAYKQYLQDTLSYADCSLSLIERTLVSKVYKTKSYSVVLTETDESIIKEAAIQIAQSSDELGFNPETDTITIQGSRQNKDGVLVGRLQVIVNYNENPPKEGKQGERRSVEITELVMKQIKKVGEKSPIDALDPDTMKKAEILRAKLEGESQSGVQPGEE